MTSDLVRAAVRRFEGARALREEDALAVEEPMEIRLVFRGTKRPSVQRLAVTMRTPGNDFELAAGFLFTEGVVRNPDDLDHLAYSPDCPSEEARNLVDVHLQPGVSVDLPRVRRAFTATSSCGLCGKASLDAVRARGLPLLPNGRPRMSPEDLPRLPDRLRTTQAVFQATGGIHAAGLFDARGRLLSSREDIGRHNAVDKVLGREFLEGRVPLSDRVLVVSGRAGFEIVQKAAVAGVPFVVAVGAPSSLAVELAKEVGMTLVGFARGTSFNVYAGEGRVCPRSHSRRVPRARPAAVLK